MAEGLDVWTHAQGYVGNLGADYHMAGICQLELLKRLGLKPSHQVLEIGCGALVAGRPLIQFLDADRYVGIEPNTWLVDAARDRFPDMAGWLLDKRPVFLARTDFDASSVGRRFDFVLSHSILSHAAHWQLPMFLSKVSETLSNSGRVLASIRFHDEHGTVMNDSMHEEWQYPGATYFAVDTMQREGERVGLKVEHVPEFKSFFVKYVPSNIHDWIVAERISLFPQTVSRPTSAVYGRPDASGLERDGSASPAVGRTGLGR